MYYSRIYIYERIFVQLNLNTMSLYVYGASGYGMSKNPAIHQYRAIPLIICRKEILCNFMEFEMFAHIVRIQQWSVHIVNACD